jgi:putative protein-disulfide isomerase
MTAILHYIYDPLCGWCYGAELLAAAATRVENLEVRLHAGGLWPEPTRLPSEMRSYIQQADARVGSISGQLYGAPYLAGLLLDPTMTLDSRPPIAAILAAEFLVPGQAFPLLRAIQRAHYVLGQRVVETDVLFHLATDLGLDRAAFEAAFRSAPVDAHIVATQRLMRRIGARGFPTFVLELDGQLYGVPHERYASDPPGFGAWLTREIGVRPTTTAASHH